MAQHYMKATVEAQAYCSPCRKRTMRRIDDGRLGPCLECIAKREREAAERVKVEAPAQQMGLFGGSGKL